MNIYTEFTTNTHGCMTKGNRVKIREREKKIAISVIGFKKKKILVSN